MKVLPRVLTTIRTVIDLPEQIIKELSFFLNFSYNTYVAYIRL